MFRIKLDVRLRGRDVIPKGTQRIRTLDGVLERVHAHLGVVAI
jgi:hypothetical protein